MNNPIPANDAPVKKCTLCGGFFGIDQFYKAPGCADGYASQCKTCVKARARKRNYEKAEQIRAYDRERSKLPHRRLKAAARVIARAARSPEKRAANIIVGNAVRDGRLRPMDCAFCGERKTVAHHHDYADPLNVTWLCTPCHCRFHALERMAMKAKERG